MARGLVLLTFLMSTVASAQSPAVSPADAKAIRTVIEAQLDAFKRDDAPRAVSYASNGRV